MFFCFFYFPSRTFCFLRALCGPVCFSFFLRVSSCCSPAERRSSRTRESRPQPIRLSPGKRCRASHASGGSPGDTPPAQYTYHTRQRHSNEFLVNQEARTPYPMSDQRHSPGEKGKLLKVKCGTNRQDPTLKTRTPEDNKMWQCKPWH